MTIIEAFEILNIKKKNPNLKEIQKAYHKIVKINSLNKTQTKNSISYFQKVKDAYNFLNNENNYKYQEKKQEFASHCSNCNTEIFLSKKKWMKEYNYQKKGTIGPTDNLYYCEECQEYDKLKQNVNMSNTNPSNTNVQNTSEENNVSETTVVTNEKAAENNNSENANTSNNKIYDYNEYHSNNTNDSIKNKSFFKQKKVIVLIIFTIIIALLIIGGIVGTLLYFFVFKH